MTLPTFGGRRFLLVLGCGIVCSFLVYRAKISDIVFRDIVIGTVAVYIAGNTAQKHAQIKAGNAVSLNP
jgi:hypothetical protein